MDTVAYVDRARPGAENMAIDRQLLEAAERSGCAFVRLYRWSEPTLSLGHFQADTDRNLHPPSRNLPVVLRASGGGAIVHDREWTYSIALPIGRNKIGASKELYDAVHGALVDGLRSLGWDASQWIKSCAVDIETSLKSSPSGESLQACGGSKPAEPLLCFQRRSCGDIVCEGFKVVGSAQRRLGGSVLQHGSILCQRSPFAPELPGLCDLSRTLSRTALAPLSRRALAAVKSEPDIRSLEPNADAFNENKPITTRSVSEGRPSGNGSSGPEGDASLTGASALRLSDDARRLSDSLAEDSPFNMETFGSVVLSWALAPLTQEFGCRVVGSDVSELCAALERV